MWWQQQVMIVDKTSDVWPFISHSIIVTQQSMLSHNIRSPKVLERCQIFPHNPPCYTDCVLASCHSMEACYSLSSPWCGFILVADIIEYCHNCSIFWLPAVILNRRVWKVFISLISDLCFKQVIQKNTKKSWPQFFHGNICVITVYTRPIKLQKIKFQ